MQTNTPWLTILEATGDDRENFLQGQLTQDLNRIDASRPTQLAASCDAKGRVLTVLTLARLDERLLIIIRSDRVDDWLGHILRFRLRAKVSIERADDLTLIAEAASPQDPQWSPLDPETGRAIPGQWRFGQIVERVIDSPATGSPASLPTPDWQAARLAAGVLDVGPEAAALYTPHMLNLDRQHAISFAKGCYTGQEVVARTEHLGRVKRRATLISASVPLTVGDAIMAGDQQQGRIALAVGDRGAAVLPCEDSGETLALASGASVTRVANPV